MSEYVASVDISTGPYRAVQIIYEVFSECQRKDRYGHERCPSWLDSVDPMPPYRILCSCGCHRRPF